MSVTKSTEIQMLTDIDNDIIEQFFDDFQNAAIVSKIYNCDEQSSINELNLSVHDVISEVTTATRALQKADKVVNKRKPNLALQNSKFVPISFLQPSPEVPKQATASKFESQYFSNTQLINVAENAEAIYESSKGITQEFDVDFAPNIPVSQCSVYSQDNAIKDSPSPILSCKKSSNNSTPRLTVNLDVFEKFENIATSLINSNNFNTEEAKVLIHSQILNNELEIHGDCTDNVDKYDSSHNLVQEFEKIDDSTTGSFLDDEILFSSDEEEYVQKDLKDLPSTCELNTSTSDNESEILDKTLYVGFITANNRPIQITSESYCKANNIFNETVNEVDLNAFNRNTDLEKSKDDNIRMSPVLNRIGQKSLKVKTKSYYGKKEIPKNMQPKTPSNRIINTPNKPLTRKDVIFKMLKDESVSASRSESKGTIKSSLAKSKSSISDKYQTNTEACKSKYMEKLEEDLFADDLSFNDLACTQDYKELSKFNTKTNENLSDEVLAKTKHWFNNIDIANHCENTLKENVDSASKFEFGFRTASNKGIDISDTALAKTKHILQNIKEDKEILNDKLNIPINVDIEMTDATSVKSSELFEELDENSEHCMETIKNMNSKFEEIDTANDKNILISKNLINTEHNIDELNMNEIEESIINNDINIGFKTASDKNVQISEKALAMSKRVFQVIDVEGSTRSGDKKIVGFKTASNKNVQISERALAISKHIFHGLDRDDEKPTSSEKEIVGFKTASNKNVQISEKALAISKHIFHGLDRDDEKPTSSEKEIVGFKTASNTNLQISEKTLAISKHIFHGLDRDDEKPTSSEKEIVGFKTASNKNVQISEKALALSKHIFHGLDRDDEKPTSSEMEIVGFKTASNKNVQISEKALAISKHIFHGIDRDDEKPASSEKEIVGFKTASNKNVQISEKALAISKHIFHGIDRDDEKPASSEKEIVGFKTASNKNVQISEKALALSKHIFHGLDRDDEKPTSSEKEIVGFKTASNKNVQISEKALAISKHIFHGIDRDDEKPASSEKEIVGFKTASNKNVQISEKALAISKHIFHGIDRDDEKPASSEKEIVGFKTASNKNVQISEKALALSKHIFHGLDRDDEKPTSSEKEIVGFKTASNKNVQISEKALAISKHIFHGIDGDDEKPTSSEKEIVVFKTASNKYVKISEEALSKTQHFFKNIDVDEQEPMDCDNDKYKTENNDLILGDTLDMVDDDAINIDLKACNRDVTTFGGFFTANNKTIQVSDEALVRTKNLFKDIDTDMDASIPKFEGIKSCNNNRIEVSESELVKSKCLFQNLPDSSANKSDLKNCKDDYIKKNKEKTGDIQLESNFNDINDVAELSQILKGFITGNNESVAVSKEAILKSKNLFKKSFHINNNEKNIDNSNDITNLIDTQLSKDFEHNMDNEDFCKATQNLKRPASPVLVYTKVKRMKLENEKTQVVTAKFDENYKKHKTMTLKDLNDGSNMISLDPFLLKYDFDNILNIVFEGDRNKLTQNKITIVNITNIFKESVNKNIIPEGWIENHVKLILWKLLSYEIKFPNKMKGICNVTEILNQLKYRYDRELYNVQRPALRKILEKDESPAKTLILCVVRIFANNASVSRIINKSDSIELEVTDGWYCLRAVIDKILCKLVHQGKIIVGTKIVTQGAELVNCDHGVAPWEDTSSIRLKISANSTRRVKWDSKLGFYRGGITAYLPHVLVGGGKVPKMRVFVSRVYPLLYVERLEDGSTVSRTERQEEMHQMRYESDRQLRMEKLYEEVSREQSDMESQCTGRGDGSLQTGSQIARAMRVAKDPEELRATLTESQSRSLHDYQTKKSVLIAEELRKEVNERLNKCYNRRSVVRLLKIRVNGFYMKNVCMKSCGGLLSIWRVDEDILETVAEGIWIDLYNVLPTGMRNSELQLSANRQTLIDVSNSREKKYSGFTKHLQRKCVKISDLVANPYMKSPYDEFDLIGLVFHIDPTTEEFEKRGKTNNFQNLYLTDRDMRFVCVNFWGGIRKTGYEKLLTIGQVVAGVNLRSRVGNSGKTIPHFRFLESSHFTKSPKYMDLKTNMTSIVNLFSRIDIAKFCKDCVCLKDQMLLRKFKRNDMSDASFASPLPNYLDDFDLSAADFESTFKQSQSQSPSMLRKTMVNDKIEKLRKMYGEPPPLSPICIKNRGTNVAKSFKSPFSITNEGSVANIENQQELEATMKRRPVKRVFSGNPVKLDFCQNENLPRKDSSSPPMSLD